MGLKEDGEITNFYKRKIEPYVAIFILAFLIVGVVLLYQDNVLKKEISKNCGYETEKYKCYCEEKMIEDFNLKNEYLKNSVEGLNVTLDR